MKLIEIMLVTLVAGTVRSNADILFDGKWSMEDGKLTERWRVVQVVAPDRFRLDREASPAADTGVVRVEVRSGDDPINSSGERAEVADMLDGKGEHLAVPSASKREFYALSVKLDKAWKAPKAVSGPAWGTFFQLHGPDTLHASPSIALMADDNFHLDTWAGDLNEKQKNGNPKWSGHWQFSDGSLNLGRWNQFLLEVEWSETESGSIKVYRRDEGKTAWKKVLDLKRTPTLQYVKGAAVGPHYWKCGFYRCKTANMTNVLWLGPIVRATTKEEAIQAAFGR
jgi:hypothetical protein